MLYMVHSTDKPGVAELVKATLETHLKYLDDHKGPLVLAGGTRAEDGVTRLGSVFLLNMPNRAAVEAWLKDEPFTKAGVYQTQTITRMRRGQWYPEHAPKTAEGD